MPIFQVINVNLFNIKQSNDSHENKTGFYICSRGENVGYPTKEKKYENSFFVSTDNQLLNIDYFYYMVYLMFQKKEFNKIKKGSVIPFITIKDTKELITDFLIKNNG